jgi:hypothetical protein
MQEGQKIAEMRAKGMQELVLDKLVEVLEAEKANLQSMIDKMLDVIADRHEKFNAERVQVVKAHEEELKKVHASLEYYRGEHARVARNLQTRANNDHVFSELVRSTKALAEMVQRDRRSVQRGVLHDLAGQANRVANAAIVSLEAQASR